MNASNENPYFTIPGLEEKTEQQILEMSVAHVLRMGRKSLRNKAASLVEDGFVCCYSGIGCAARPFLREECLSAADKIGAWNNLVGAHCAPQKHQKLIQQLQSCHDGADSQRFMERYKENIRKLLKIYPHLTAPEGIA